MATSSALRLMSDLKTVKQQPPEGVSASPLSEENLYVWGATVFGPDDTSWEGGIYTMRLMFTEQYPDKPPRVRFTTEMVRSRPPLTRGWGWVKDGCGSDLAALPPQFHPNIYPDGTLCLDLIQDNWSPIYSVAQPVTTDLAPARELGCGRTGRSALSQPPRSPPTRRPSIPHWQVSSILIAIRSLLTDPNCASPANPEAAHLYQTDRKQYGRKVRRIAEKSVS